MKHLQTDVDLNFAMLILSSTIQLNKKTMSTHFKSTKLDVISNELVSLYKKDSPTSEYVYVAYNTNITYNSLVDAKNKARKKRLKKFHIVDIQPVNNKFLPTYCTGINLVKEKTSTYFNIKSGTTQKKKTRKTKTESKLSISDITGLFKVHFSDGSFMYYAKWISGFGKGSTIENLVASEKSVWVKYLQMEFTERKRQEKPKPGIYRANMATSPFGSYLVYKEVKDLIEMPIVHKEVDNLKKDLEFFFDNINLFTRYRQKGVRKVLLVGEPGTGKSSICMKVAKQYSKEKCIIFATDIQTVAMHLVRCQKHNTSTIIIFEDVESSFQKGLTDGAVLNFMDGIDQPTMTKGAYMIMTTNHPKQIEDRILKRPGRIDKFFMFNALTGIYAIQCANIYFNEILFNDKNTKQEKIDLLKQLYTVVNGMTGAQIKELANSSMSYAVSNMCDINVELIAEVKQKTFEAFKNVDKYAEATSLGNNIPIGFDQLNKNNNDLIEETEYEEIVTSTNDENVINKIL